MDFGLSSVNRKCLLYSSGFDLEDLNKPLVGIITQSSKLHPGEVHVDRIVSEVEHAVIENGGMPVHINLGGWCDGITMGNRFYTFAQRNLIADTIEVAVEGNLIDALVLIASCDKNVPAALMAAGRLNVPAVMVTGGIMAPGWMDGSQLTVDDVNVAIGKVTQKQMTELELDELIEKSCPGGGACCTLTTGSTMQMITEALGMSLPGNSSMLGMGREILALARRAGKLIMDLYERGICPRDIITEKSIDNAIKVCLAVGGSMHSLYHVPAIGVEAGLELPYWEKFDEYSSYIPCLTGIVPNGEYTMFDFHLAGGLPAVMKNIAQYLDESPMTVTGQPIGTYYANAKCTNPDVIRTVDEPWSPSAGLAVLKGNIATEGAIVRTSGVRSDMMVFEGTARVFTDDIEARSFLRKNPPTEPTVFVVTYQGVQGAPGINTLLPVSAEIIGMGLEPKVALVTDGRFSGGARGLCVGLVSPEAAAGGELGCVRDGDKVRIDIPNRSIQLLVSEEELQRRRGEFAPHLREIKSTYLRNFLRAVQPLTRGGVSGEWTRTGYRRITDDTEVTP